MLDVGVGLREVRSRRVRRVRVVPHGSLARKPVSLTFEQAAAVPLCGVTALQGLRAGNLRAGQHVLIIGESGGVGTFAVQLAKHLGAQVTGVCSTANLDVVRGLGADHVLDYRTQDITGGPARYDLVFSWAGRTPRPPCAGSSGPAAH
jgi:NADPH:quinone reductase-like Zn-dependent oxidoreductase